MQTIMYSTKPLCHIVLLLFAHTQSLCALERSRVTDIAPMSIQKSHLSLQDISDNTFLKNPPKIYVAIQDTNHHSNHIDGASPHSLADSKQGLSFDVPAYYKPDSAGKYLGTTIGLLSGGIVVSIVGLYLMPESVTNWDRSRFGLQAWYEDVRIGPVIDRDNFFLNGITHPYFGAVYYMQPRVAGYSWAESALFSFITSAIFWEYGIEAFVEIPSWQDLIYTPAIGSIFGEIFYQSTKYIQSHNNRLFGSKILGHILVAFMDPIGMIMRDLGLAKMVGINDMREVVSWSSPFGMGFAMRF